MSQTRELNQVELVLRFTAVALARFARSARSGVQLEALSADCFNWYETVQSSYAGLWLKTARPARKGASRIEIFE